MQMFKIMNIYIFTVITLISVGCYPQKGTNNINTMLLPEITNEIERLDLKKFHNNNIDGKYIM